MDEDFDSLTPDQLSALDAAVAVIQGECSYCVQGVPELLERRALELLHTTQILVACRALPLSDSNRVNHLATMSRKHAELLEWDDMYHPRSRRICGACQLATRRCISLWREARG